MAKPNKWYNTNWTIGIVTGSVLPIMVTLIIDKVKDKPILSSLISVFKFIWFGSIDIINFELKIWWLISAYIIYRIIKFIIINSKTKEKDLTTYTRDRLKSWKWSWEWKYNPRLNVWQVINLTPHCTANSICDTQMLKTLEPYGMIKYKCPRCGHTTGNIIEDERDIDALIIDNVNKKNFVNCD